MRRRVVITGTGAVTPLGVGAERLLSRWLAGDSGVEDGVARCADFEPTDVLSRKDARRTDRFTQLAVGAADEAIAQAGWDGAIPYDPDRVACIMGTGIGGLATAERALGAFYQDETMPPLTIPLMMPNASAGGLALRYGLTGPAFGVVSACAAGADAIGTALRLVRSGEADAAVTGGSEAAATPFAQQAFGLLEATSRNGVSRPFDAERDGFVIGEGAGVLVLEERDAAIARGADILGELLGFAATADAHHLVAPDPNGAGAARAMAAAMTDAGVAPGRIDYVNAHGTSTELNDRAETAALKSALGGDAHRVPVSSLKSSIGHLLGAAGAVEAVATVHALDRRMAPPTLNYAVAEPGLDLDYVTGGPVPLAVRQNGAGPAPAVALSNSFGFGGHNAVLCLAGAR
jgi:3-oxoacyl-[acyl-carrier-protein] synthase II